MSSITEHLSTLVSQSSSILSDLNSDLLSVEELASKMDLRDNTIRMLDAHKEDLNNSSFSDEDREEIKSLFDKFERLNSKIDRALKDALNKSRENLAAATTTRKADDKYRVLAKPDITHF
ncbi:hypothetical protein [Rhodohalobacter sp. 8-1]|uniref:hypothetical protein n=1 Tax=Rhodohalobacter sp. 8-1 TaxID=3131972 RepID=UPI0030EC3BE4